MSNSFFWFPTSPYRFAPLTLARSSAVNARFDEVSDGFDGVQTALDLKADRAGPTFTGTATFDSIIATGTVDFDAASIVTVPAIASVADSSLKAATTAFVQAVLGASGALLPPQTTHAGKFLKTDGTSASWQLPTIANFSLSGNTTLDASYSASYIKVTGSPTLTLSAPATLGASWYAIVENAGTGSVALAHTSGNIDGLTSYTVYPGEVRLLRCDGTTVISTVLVPFRLFLTASTTISMPPGYRKLGFDMMGGGAGGASGARGPSTSPSLLGGVGGSGGGRYFGELDAPAAGIVVTLTVGAGGTGSPARTVDGASSAGNSGSASTIAWSSVTRAYVGGGVGSNRIGGSAVAQVSSFLGSTTGFIGAGVSGVNVGSSEFGGATGAPADSSGASATIGGGCSVFGGPGGGAGGGGQGAASSGSAGGVRGGVYNTHGGGGSGGSAGADGGTAANSGGGGGGVGAASSGHSRGGNGGNGTGYGSGGGGGGAAIGAINSGAGGNGADGCVDIWGEP